MKPEDDIIFLAKDNPSPASQVGHIARYFTKLGEGYILIYYLLFIYFFNVIVFSAALLSILNCKPLIESGISGWGKILGVIPMGMVGAPDAVSLPCVHLPYGTGRLCSSVEEDSWVSHGAGGRRWFSEQNIWK